MLPKNSIKRTVFTLVAFVVLIFGVFIAQIIPSKKSFAVDQFNGTLLSHPRPIQPFTLTGVDGSTFNNQSLQGQWTLLFFGFTHCGYLCPTTMAELATLYRQLEEKQAKVLPRVVMISIDPERDDATTLDHYVKTFNPHFYGALGSSEKIKQLTNDLGIVYAKVTTKTGASVNQNDFDHSGTILLFNPQGELTEFFTTPHEASQLAADFMKLSSE